MSKKNKLLEKLIIASGGWEQFLYETLKDLYTEMETGVGDFSKGVDALDYAKEILEAYEELDHGQLDKARKIPVFEGEPDDEDVPDRKKPVRVTPVIKTMKTESVDVPAEDVEWKLEDLVLSPPPRGVPNPRRERGRVYVDKDLGGSSGELPMPSGHKLVNRSALTITTENGMLLGGASAKQGEEGQINSQHVTGHVSVTGRYRLVFTDASLGAALIQYDVVALPSKMTSKQYKTAVAGANKLSVEELCERLEHFGLVFEKCRCGKEDCFGWRIIDQADAEVTRAIPKSPTEVQARLQQGLDKQAQRAEDLGVAEGTSRDIGMG